MAPRKTPLLIRLLHSVAGLPAGIVLQLPPHMTYALLTRSDMARPVGSRRTTPHAVITDMDLQLAGIGTGTGWLAS